ncbi:MAG: hypothetical protein O7G85_17575 [Planctomycetota bacterium]|nr:hypothetical protein [Planctomycetota bacterium]
MSSNWLIPIALATCLQTAQAYDYPPLTPDQSTALETAYDGRDHQEAAFIALVENASDYDGNVGDASLRMNPDLEVMLERPGEFRGDLCRLEGVLQQQTELIGAHAGTLEWFLRDESGTPFVVYVVEGARIQFQDGERFQIIARFYKRVAFEARDGEVRDYAAFVGAKPIPIITRSSDLGPIWLVLVIILIMFGVFLFLFLYVRGKRGPLPRRGQHATGTHPGAGPGVDEGGALPDDPADALTELRHRSGEETPPSPHDEQA